MENCRITFVVNEVARECRRSGMSCASPRTLVSGSMASTGRNSRGRSVFKIFSVLVVVALAERLVRRGGGGGGGISSEGVLNHRNRMHERARSIDHFTSNRIDLFDAWKSKRAHLHQSRRLVRDVETKLKGEEERTINSDETKVDSHRLFS